MSRIAVTSRSFSRHPVLRAELLARYPDTTFNDAGLKLTGQSLIDFLKGHDKAITALEVIDGTVLAAVPELKVIGKYGVGLDMIDLNALHQHGVKLGWSGGVNKRSVSELVISCAIALLRHVPAANQEIRGGTFRQHVGRQLTGLRMGIIGCGHIGKDLAVLLQAFGCEILAHDIKDFPEFYAAHGVRPVDLPTLLSESEIVTLHLPMDNSTRGMINAEHLDMMRPDAILINAARGGLVDEDALKSRLMDGRLAGAAFDVFAVEPPEDQEFVNLPNMLAMPHIGGSSQEAILAMARSAIAGLDDASDPLSYE